MVYKKYIKKDGKVFGPYLYENYRENGIVKTRYLGMGTPDSPKRVWGNKKKEFIFLGFLVVLLSLFFALQLSPTGKVTLDLYPSYQSGQIVSGIVKFSLSSEEFIPADSLVTFSLNNQSKSIPLKDLVSNSKSGNFYVENSNLNGSGEGFGQESEVIYPTVNLEYKILSLEDSTNSDEPTIVNSSSDFSNESNEEDSITEEPAIENETEMQTEEESSNEDSSEVLTEQDSEDISNEENSLATESNSEVSEQDSVPDSSSDEESSDSSSSEESSPESSDDSSSDSGISITGAVISDSDKTYFAEISNGKPLIIVLNDKEQIELVSASIDGEQISLDNINLESNEGEIIISTNYSYLENVSTLLELDLEDFNILAETGELIVNLSYDENEIVSVFKEINVDEIEVNLENKTEEPIVLNETIINDTLVNETEINETFVNETLFNQTIFCNDTILENCTNFTSLELNITNFTITTVVSNIRVGEPVKWKKIVKLDKPTENVSVEIPSIAENITVVSNISNQKKWKSAMN
jgi:hypothetical protein